MTEYGFNPFSDSIKLKQNISAFKKIERYTPNGTATEIDVQNPILYLNESSIASPVFDGVIPKTQRTSLLWSIVDGDATIAANIGGMIRLYDTDTASYVWHTVTDIIIGSPEASSNPEDVLTPDYIIITFLGDGIDGSMRYDTPESTYVTTASESWENKSVGTDGWILSSEGNAIFNNIAIRGEIEATRLSINSNEAGDSTTTGIYWTGDPDDPLYIGADVNILGTVTAEALTLNDYNYWTPTLTGAAFRVGGATSGIIWNGTTFEIKGDLVTGTIGASSGGINGWNISEGLFASGETTTYVALSASPSNAYSIWAGGETASTAPFSVKRDGTLRATNATITGNITATSGTFTGAINATSGTFTNTVYVGNNATASNNIQLIGTATAATTAIGIGSGTLGYNTTTTKFWADASGRFSLGQGLLWDGTNLTINGSGTFSGSLSAASGSFTGALTGGTISIGTGNSIFKADSNGIYLGNATFGSAPFRVTSAGALTATNATITGNVTATSGTFTGAINASSGTFTGYVSAGTSRFGVAVQTGKDGIWLDANNYAYSDGTFSFGGADGITYNGTGSILIGTDVEITGGVTATSFAIDANNYWNTPGNEGIFSSTSGKLGNWTLNSEEIFSDISDSGNTYRTGIKAATGIGGGTYTPSVFYMVHDHDTEGAIPTFNSANTPFYADSNGRFSLADKLYFDQDIHGSGNNAQLTVIGKIRGQIENTELALDAIPNANAKTITQIEITATDTAIITASTHGFAADDTVIISDLATTVLNGAWKVFSVTTNTFTIKSDGLTVDAAYADSGLARIRELTLGLHPAVGTSPAGLGIRLDEYNYWFVNNKFRIGGSVNYVNWSGSQLEVKGTINDLELGRGGGNIASNFAVGIGALDSNTTGVNNVALGEDALTLNATGSGNLAVGFTALFLNEAGDNNIALGVGAAFNNKSSSIVAIGYNALYKNSTGFNNVGIGTSALYNTTIGENNVGIGINALYSNTTGWSNVAIGGGTLFDNTTGTGNIAVGSGALSSNTYGSYNVAFGLSSLYNNTTGNNNLAFGFGAASANQTGSNNVAIGTRSLQSNTVDNNVGIGISTLTSNTTGTNNLAIGSFSLSLNTTGIQNIAIGSESLRSNTVASNNIAIGFKSLKSSTRASSLIAIGTFALENNDGDSDNSEDPGGIDNIAIGGSALRANTTGRSNIAIGSSSLSLNTTGFENLAIGYSALLNNTTGIRNAAIGSEALYSNISGYNNIAIGNQALFSNKSNYNLAIGDKALGFNTTGEGNFAIGSGALGSNISGFANLSVGTLSMSANVSGNQNVAIGSQALRYNSSGSSNVAIGFSSLISNVSGSGNIAIGNFSLQKSLVSNNLAIGNSALSANTTGAQNVAIGESALQNNVTGSWNTAIGGIALYQNKADYNTAIGQSALWVNTTGTRNLAIGAFSLNSNTTGSYNLAIGSESLYGNISGTYNLAIGDQALKSNLQGFNTAIGYQSLTSNVTGNFNTAIGYQSLKSNLVDSNTGIGYQSLFSNTTGTNNLAIGFESLKLNTTGTENLAIGFQALVSNTTGTENLAIGYMALRSNVSGQDNIAIGGGALSGTTTATNNIAIGLGSGANITTGSKNVILGPNTGSSIATSSNNIIISDGDGNIRIKSDSNGTVTMPDQPRFLAVRSSSYSHNPGGPVIFNSATYNVGNNYNIETGLFTAPVSGNYIFQVGIYQSAAIKQIWFIKNYSRERNLFTDTVATGSFLQGMGMIYLVAGDNVGIISLSSGTATPVTIYADTNYTYFRGQLVN
jgi:hypothetical protein